MNDRVSLKPPAIFTGDEEAMERYAGGQGANEDSMDISYDSGVDTDRPSGMHRFGKVIASTFNPSNIWQGINAMWKEKETKTPTEKQVLQERQAKAVEAYAELKRIGYKGTQVGPARRWSEDIPTVKLESTEDERHSFRDSGVDVNDYRSSSNRKDNSQSTLSVDTLRVPQTRTSNYRSPSPLSETGSGRKSSLHFRKPSLQSLTKAKSHLHLPSTKQEANLSPRPCPIETTDSIDPVLIGSSLRKEPSRKDIAKQYKLSKKVSDLENKLEIARRELEMSLSTAPPIPEVPSHVGRKPFVPGALASLPSEGNMFPQGRANEESAIPTAEELPLEPKIHRKRGVDDARPLNSEDSTTKHATMSLTFAERISLAASDKCKVDKTGAEMKKGSKGDLAMSSTSTELSERPIRSRDITSTSMSVPAVPKHRPQDPSKTPQNSPVVRIVEDAPPMPPLPENVDPIKIDQAKILSMRSDRKGKAPFGALPEDIHNLWKAYPEAADGQLAEYIRHQPGFNKITNQSPIMHPNRSSSLLGRPTPSSPRMTRSKGHKRGTSPPPPSLSSAKKVKVDPVKPEGENRVLRKKPAGLIQAEVRKSHHDKPLPEIQKEDYEWPEDVF